MPRRLLIIYSIILLFTSIAMPQAVSAKPDKGKALKLIASGDKHLAKGDRYTSKNKVERGQESYAKALAAYQEAYENLPNAQIYYPIALAEQKLGKYLESIQHYQAVLEKTEDASKELVAEVNSAIAEVRKQLSGLEIIVEQDGAKLIVDGESIGVSPLSSIHYMKPGEHQYVVELKGYTPVEESLDTEEGEVVRRSFRLELVSKKTKKKKQDADGEENEDYFLDEERVVSYKPVTIAFGVAGGLLIGSVFSAIQANAKHSRFEDMDKSAASREAAKESGKKYRLATDVFLGGAILAIGFGTYYYYYKYKPAYKELMHSSVWVSPYAKGKEAGMALGASF